MAGIPRSTASRAAPRVPEYQAARPMFSPLLMPETTRSGWSFSSTTVSPTAVTDAGVASTDQAGAPPISFVGSDGDLAADDDGVADPALLLGGSDDGDPVAGIGGEDGGHRGEARRVDAVVVDQHDVERGLGLGFSGTAGEQQKTRENCCASHHGNNLRCRCGGV